MTLSPCSIDVHDDCNTIFKDLKKHNSSIKYIVYKISDDNKSVVVDFLGKLKTNKEKTSEDKTDEDKASEDKTSEDDTSRENIYEAETSVEDIYNDFREKLTSITAIDPKSKKEKPAPRYAVYDIEYEMPNNEGSRCASISYNLACISLTGLFCSNTIIFISWVPDDAALKVS